jgi:hypothetical protein
MQTSPAKTLLTTAGYTADVAPAIDALQEAESIGEEFAGAIIGDVEDLALSQPIDNKLEIPGVGDSLPVTFNVPFTGKTYKGSLEVETEDGKVYLIFKAAPTT